MKYMLFVFENSQTLVIAYSYNMKYSIWESIQYMKKYCPGPSFFYVTLYLLLPGILDHILSTSK